MSMHSKARDLILDGDARKADEWRSASPEHDEAFREAQRAWTAIGRTRYARDGRWRLETKKDHIRWLPAAGAVAASVAAIAISAPQLMGPQPQRLRTDVAQTRAVALADGSTVYVGAKSAVDVKLDEDARTVVLKEGEAFFEVAPGDKRPFTVVAGGAVIRVKGTKFNVCRTPYGVQISVLEGRVEVAKSGLFSKGDQVVVAGEQVRLARGEGLTPRFPATGTPGSWREGRLQYADTPLKEVVADANRYSPRPVRLASSEIGELRVTASFRTSAVEELIANLDAALPIRADRQADGEIVLEPEGPN